MSLAWTSTQDDAIASYARASTLQRFNASPGRSVNFYLDEFVYSDIVTSLKMFLMTLGCGVMEIQAPTAGAVGTAALEQRTQSFIIVLRGSVADVTPLFGPVRETEWAPNWTPRFIHPPEGAQREGVVFTTTSANNKQRLWLLTAYDVKEGRVEYVFVTSDFTANKIKIRVLPDGEKQCRAVITYRHSALALEGNEEVAKLDAHWAEQQRVHWETAINAALAKGGAHD
jgi:hypothetical protein